MNAAAHSLPVDQASDEELAAALWEAGELSWKLDAHQLRVYKQYRAWEQEDPGSDSDGALTRLFVMDISRRWGKTFLCLVIKIEDCLRRPGSSHTYACAFAKDIADIVLPLSDDICDDAPDSARPVFRASKQGLSMGLFFPNGSVVKLVGIDMNPRGLRGRRSDGFVVSEAGHVVKLDSTIRDVIYPQFQRIPHARMILESNAPEDPNHAFDTVFVPDAKLRSAHVFRTIEDNEALDPREREEFIRAAGGRQNASCRREYFGERIRDPERVVVPEFDASEHVATVPMPEYAEAYVALDPGFRDLFAALFGYWHFERHQLVVQRDWAERNASTARVAEVIRSTEEELWADTQRWSNGKLKGNPYLRVSDADPRLLLDLKREHGILVGPVSKLTGARAELAEAAVHSLRHAIGQGYIVIDPACTTLIAHLESARWNEKRTDYERSEQFGHYDCLDALVYLWRSVQKHRNPVPPAKLFVPHDQMPAIIRHNEPRDRPMGSGGHEILKKLYGQQSRTGWKKGATWKRR